MAVARYYNFNERMVFSEGFLSEGIEKILTSRIPGCVKVMRANSKEDRNGTDYWALRKDLPPLSVDVKVRQEDWAPKGGDDLALETWSVIGQKPGWTRDIKKRTDYVLWFWQDTGRFVLVPFPALCRTFQRYWEEWQAHYKRNRQTSGGWQSECVFVPRQLVIQKLSDWMEGTVKESDHNG